VLLDFEVSTRPPFLGEDAGADRMRRDRTAAQSRKRRRAGRDELDKIG
jgi:hypothetical protein